MRNIIQPALRYLRGWLFALLASLLPPQLPAQVDAIVAHYVRQYELPATPPQAVDVRLARPKP